MDYGSVGMRLPLPANEQRRLMCLMHATPKRRIFRTHSVVVQIFNGDNEFIIAQKVTIKLSYLYYHSFTWVELNATTGRHQQQQQLYGLLSNRGPI